MTLRTDYCKVLLQTLEMHQPPHPSAPLAVNLDSAHFSSQPKSLTGTFSGYASLEGLSSSGALYPERGNLDDCVISRLAVNIYCELDVCSWT